MTADYQKKIIELAEDMEKHGYGEMIIRFEIIRTPLKTKITIHSGKSYVFFERRELRLDNDNLI